MSVVLDRNGDGSLKRTLTRGMCATCPSYSANGKLVAGLKLGDRPEATRVRDIANAEPDAPVVYMCGQCIDQKHKVAIGAGVEYMAAKEFPPVSSGEPRQRESA